MFVSGLLAGDRASGLDPDAQVDELSPYRSNGFVAQGESIFRRLTAILAAAQHSAQDIVRLQWWLASPYPTLDEFARGNLWPRLTAFSPYLTDTRNRHVAPSAPTSCAVAVRELPMRSALVQLEAVALDTDRPRAPISVPDDRISPPDPGYSPGLRAGDWVFLSGVLPLDLRVHQPLGVGEGSTHSPPASWHGSLVETQVERVLETLQSIAEAGGTSLRRCVHAEVYFGHPNDFYAIDRAWKRWFPEDPPARLTAPYSGLGIQGARVEIALILLADDATASPRFIQTVDAPEPFGHESQAVRAGDLLFLSSQFPVDSAGRVPLKLRGASRRWGVDRSARVQMRYLMENAAAICAAGGTSIDNVCRRRVFYRDLSDLDDAVEEARHGLNRCSPAETHVRVGFPGADVMAPGARIMLDLVAHIPAHDRRPFVDD